MKTEKEIHQHRKDEHLSLAYKYWREEKNQTSGLTFLIVESFLIVCQNYLLKNQLFIRSIWTEF